MCIRDSQQLLLIALRKCAQTLLYGCNIRETDGESEEREREGECVRGARNSQPQHNNGITLVMTVVHKLNAFFYSFHRL